MELKILEKKKKTPNHCQYQGCVKMGDVVHELELVNEENSSVQLPFCFYHYYIIMGNHFKAKSIIGEDKKIKDFELIGPFNVIEVVEQVIGAREMILSKNKETKKP